MDKKKSMPHKTTNHSAFKPNRQRWQDPAPAAVLRTGLNANYRWRSDEEGSRTRGLMRPARLYGLIVWGWLSYAVFLFWCQAGEKCSHGEPGGEHDWLIKTDEVWASWLLMGLFNAWKWLVQSGATWPVAPVLQGQWCVCVCVTRTAHITV